MENTTHGADITRHWAAGGIVLAFYFSRSAFERGSHHILRLPPYHSDLNLIELVWIQIKTASCDFELRMSLALLLVHILLHQTQLEHSRYIPPLKFEGNDSG